MKITSQDSINAVKVAKQIELNEGIIGLTTTFVGRVVEVNKNIYLSMKSNGEILSDDNGNFETFAEYTNDELLIIETGLKKVGSQATIKSNLAKALKIKAKKVQRLKLFMDNYFNSAIYTIGVPDTDKARIKQKRTALHPVIISILDEIGGFTPDSVTIKQQTTEISELQRALEQSQTALEEANKNK